MVWTIVVVAVVVSQGKKMTMGVVEDGVEVLLEEPIETDRVMVPVTSVEDPPRSCWNNTT